MPQSSHTSTAPGTSDGVTPAPKPRLHLDYLDGLRALAALFVACYHCYLAVYIHTSASGVSRWISEPMLYGHLAVPLFIVISGFCLMLPVVRDNGVLRGGAAFFFRKRFWRILPTYYGALILFLSAHYLENHHVPNGKDILTHVFLIHNLWPDTFRGNINPSFWSIAVEWQIYFAFPLLVLGWRRVGAVPTLLATLAVSISAFFVLNGTPLAGITPQFYGLFALGMFGSQIAFSTDRPLKMLRECVPWGWIAVALLLGGVAASRVWGPGTDVGYQVCALHLFAGLTAMCVLVAAARSRGSALTRALSWRPLAFLGAFSYSIYLLHQPCLHLVLRLFQRFSVSVDTLYLLLTFIGIPIVVAAAYGFYLCCERPFVQANARLRKA
jgi:peptidoglycan/LPS O-acetylase OafA/YrhL